MPVKPIPEGYHTVTPYLVVQGADKVIEFLKQAFNAKEKFRMDRPDGKIGHAEIKVGDSQVMIAEAGGDHPAMPAMIHLYVEDVDAAYQRAIQAGGESLREPADQFYGDRGAGVKDAAGNHWWIATHIEDVPPEELDKRAKAAMKGGG